MRVTFATDDTVKYVGHLDMARAWERAIRRARLPLAYSQGFNPQARMHFAAALPVGFTGQAELIDVFLDAEVEPADFLARLAPALPAGIRLTGAEAVSRELPSLAGGHLRRALPRRAGDRRVGRSVREPAGRLHGAGRGMA